MVTQQKISTPYDVIEVSYSNFEQCVHWAEDGSPDWINLAGRTAEIALKAIILSRIDYAEAVQPNLERIEEIEDACLEYLIN